MNRRAYIGVNFVRAIVFVALLARSALQAAEYLRADTDALADFEFGDLVADARDVPDDLVAGNEGQL